MTVGELKELLEDYDDGMEVRTMQQPSWPFEYSVSGVTSRKEMTGGDGNCGECGEWINPADGEDCTQCGPMDDDKDDDCVFITEGTQLCYGSKRAWEVCDG